MSNQPLGFLVKQLDNALTRYVDSALTTAHGVGRAHWQVLRTAIDNRQLLLSKFVEEARTFYTDEELNSLLKSVTENHWVSLEPAADGDQYMVITPSGEGLLHQMMETQSGTLTIAKNGLNHADLETTTNTLERMAANLQKASDAAGFG